MASKKITVKDFEDRGVELKQPANLFDCMAAMAPRAEEIHDQNIGKIRRTSPKKKRKATTTLPETSIAAENEQEEEKQEKRTAAVEAKRSSGTKSKKNANNVRRREPVSHRPLQPPPPLPEAFKNAVKEMAGTGRNVSPEVFVIQKALYESDLSPQQNRFTIPNKQINDDFLNEDEKTHLRGRDERKKKRYTTVRIVEPTMREGKVDLRRWEMHKGNGSVSTSYCLSGSWNKLCKENGLKVKDVVQLWAFRIDEQELVFALVKVPPPPRINHQVEDSVSDGLRNMALSEQ